MKRRTQTVLGIPVSLPLTMPTVPDMKCNKIFEFEEISEEQYSDRSPARSIHTKSRRTHEFHVSHDC